MIFHKHSALNIIFYDGSNGQEILNFFHNKPYGKYLYISEKGTLHYKKEGWLKEDKTLVKPNNYIYFRYDEDDWWDLIHISIENFNKDYIKIN